ncbi:LOW QUALITY PROTEIN: NADPH oxidase 5 [Trichechus inunguis]
MSPLGDPAQPDPEGCRSTMNAEEDAKWLQWVTYQFEMAGKDKISLQEFKTALNMKESFFAERFCTLFDSDGSGTITLQKLQEALALLIHGRTTDKLKFLFQVYVDGKGSSWGGSIDPDEFRPVLQSCLRESAISLPDEKLDQLTLALFESAGEDGSGAITFDELRDELQHFPGVMENLTISAAHWLTPPSALPRPRRPRPLTLAYWHNHRSQLCLAAYWVLCVLLFAVAASAPRTLGPSIMVARGCGQCLNFNCSFIAVLMLRRCLTWLRSTRLAQVLPLDQTIQFHQVMGYVVVGLSLVHTVAHVVNFVLQAQSQASPLQSGELLHIARPGVGWAHVPAVLTWTRVALPLLLLMFACSSSCVHRSWHFAVFYWTHLSYLPIWGLLIMHGLNFKWLLVPGILFFLEKVIGLAASRMAALCIVEVNLLASKVTHLLIKRPPLFHYRPGDYLYLNEWHPFTISRAPEQKDTIWLHIRTQGQWTNRLYESFKASDPVDSGSKRLSRSLKMRKFKVQYRKLGEDFLASPQDPSRTMPRAKLWDLEWPIHPCTSAQGVVASSKDVTVELLSYRPEETPWPGDQGLVYTGTKVLEMSSENHQFCNDECYVDGPYGTSPRRILLIGVGSSITPFASILQSVMYRHQKRKHICPNSWIRGIQDDEMKRHKVDFIWNNDQQAFEWFVSLLTSLEMDQTEENEDGRFLEPHTYMTSALGKNDMKAIGLQMALDLLAKKEKDSITGLQTWAQAGRPDWSKMFQKVAFEKKGKVQVFFCGSPALAKVLKGHCEQFNFKFFQENF